MNETQQTAPSQSTNSFAAMFESAEVGTGSIDLGGEGQITKGTVVQVNRDTVIVDIGGKSEGVISLDEFRGSDGITSVKAGDQVDVFIESRESDDGLISLSKEKADKMKVWDEISSACERDEIIEGTISQRVKGGLSVTIRGGVKAFLPGSQVDLRPIRNLDKLIGQSYEFKVIKFNKKRGNIVLSRRVLLERERDEMKQKTLQNLEEGMVLTGTIKNLTEYGAFVDLGGIDGLLHITDMSWGRVNHPAEVFNVGDEVTVKVLKYNPETERVSLGLKQTQEDPWNHAEEAYPVGKRVRGKVMSLTDYGSFVELEPGVEGLIHVSEMSWTKKVKHPSKMMNVGDEVECQVLEVDGRAKRISLGLKQLEPDPWTLFTDKYKPGDRVSGKVRSITDYGVFVGIEEGVDGMVHKTDLSWTVKINNPADLFNKGDDVEAIILSINHDEKKVSLGVKQLWDDPWGIVLEQYRPGTVVESVKVLSTTDYGVFVRIAEGIEALIPAGEIPPGSELRAGETLKAEIMNLDSVERRITMSLRNVGGSDQAEQVQVLNRESRQVARPLWEISCARSLERSSRASFLKPPHRTTKRKSEPRERSAFRTPMGAGAQSCMTERLWAPWRMEFLRAPKLGANGCVLCAYVGVAPASGTLVLARRRHAFVVLNKYPYTSGHIMVVPTRHTAELTDLTPEENQALWQLTQECVAPLRATTRCDAINIGVNLGQAAGAGIREHLHVHLVPRWEGDNNFMPVLADVRVVPESLEGTRTHLSSAFEVLSSDTE